MTATWRQSSATLPLASSQRIPQSEERFEFTRVILVLVNSGRRVHEVGSKLPVWVPAVWLYHRPGAHQCFQRRASITYAIIIDISANAKRYISKLSSVILEATLCVMISTQFAMPLYLGPKTSFYPHTDMWSQTPIATIRTGQLTTYIAGAQ